MSRNKITAAKLKEMNEKAPYLFYQNRVATFKKFIFDLEKNANCTSIKLAQAGFYCTASPDSPSAAKCPFCLKELEFDAEDDPWEEHTKRGKDCEFVKLNKDESLWTVREVLKLGSVSNINAKYSENQEIIDDLSTRGNINNLTKLLISNADLKPMRSKRIK